jgi:hypothetical protein
MGSSSKKVTVGYKYYLGVHMVLCHGPVDSITKIEVDDRVAWTGSASGGQIAISAPELFGGDEREGGISGAVDIEMGGPTQGRNSYLQSILGTDIPAFRGVVGAVLRQCYMGNNPYIKRWAFWATRTNVRSDGTEQWYVAKAAIGSSMNPAHIVRECLTDRNWGMGYPEADMDDTAFAVAADTLYAEGMGISLLWDQGAEISDFISQILEHIDGSLYVSRTTGKFVLKLAREDYSLGDLIVLDENSVERVTDFKRKSLGDLVNSVTVKYWDEATGKDNSITVQDPALVSLQGASVGTTVNYPGFTNGELASRAASRDLRALSTPLASATIYANRTAAGLSVGDVFVLSWPRYGVVQMVMRVVSVEHGELDSNGVRIVAVEDVFALGSAIYAPPPPSAWTNPNGAPAPCPYHVAIEAPYWELVQRIGETQAEALPSTSGYVLITGVRPSAGALFANIYSSPYGTYEEKGRVDFCPTATLSAAITQITTTLSIEGAIDIDVVRVGSYAQIDEEFVSILSVSSSSLTVGRGVLDTVPSIHSPGARIFFLDDFAETDGVEYAIGETAKLKLSTVTGKGTLGVGSAGEQTVLIGARQDKPYPPGNFRINDSYYPPTVANNASIVVTWAHRDRLQQTATLIDSTVGNIGPEAGTTYTVEIRTLAGALVSSATGITGTAHTFTLAALGSNYGQLRVLLWSVRGGVDSLQKHDHKFTRPSP